jgi:hypothetical protein
MQDVPIRANAVSLPVFDSVEGAWRGANRGWAWMDSGLLGWARWACVVWACGVGLVGLTLSSSYSVIPYFATQWAFFWASPSPAQVQPFRPASRCCVVCWLINGHTVGQGMGSLWPAQPVFSPSVPLRPLLFLSHSHPFSGRLVVSDT